MTSVRSSRRMGGDRAQARRGGGVAANLTPVSRQLAYGIAVENQGGVCFSASSAGNAPAQNQSENPRRDRRCRGCPARCRVVCYRSRPARRIERRSARRRSDPRQNRRSGRPRYRTWFPSHSGRLVAPSPHAGESGRPTGATSVSTAPATFSSSTVSRAIGRRVGSSLRSRHAAAGAQPTGRMAQRTAPGGRSSHQSTGRSARASSGSTATAAGTLTTASCGPRCTTSGST